MFRDPDWGSTTITVRMLSHVVFLVPLRRPTYDRLKLVLSCRVDFCMVSSDLYCFRLSSIMSSCVVLEDVAQSLHETGLYSFEFEPQESQGIPSLRYWNSDHLVKIQLCRYSLALSPVQSQPLVIDRFLPFLSTAPQIVCMSWCTSEILQVVEQSSLLKKVIENQFRYKFLSLHMLMHKREESVFWRIDF